MKQHKNLVKVGNNKYMVHDGGNGKNSDISLASENTNMMYFDCSKERTYSLQEE